MSAAASSTSNPTGSSKSSNNSKKRSKASEGKPALKANGLISALGNADIHVHKDVRELAPLLDYIQMSVRLMGFQGDIVISATEIKLGDIDFTAERAKKRARQAALDELLEEISGMNLKEAKKVYTYGKNAFVGEFVPTVENKEEWCFLKKVKNDSAQSGKTEVKE